MPVPPAITSDVKSRFHGTNEMAPKPARASGFFPTAIVGGVVIALVAAYLKSHNATSGVSQTLGDCSLLVAVLSGGVFCARAARRRNLNARAWLFLTIAFLCWTFGAAVTAYYGVTRNHVYPYPSIADIGFLSYPIPTIAALLAFPRPATLLISRLRAVLDAVVIALGVMFLSSATVLDSVIDSLGAIGLTEVVMIAYPIVDVVICSVVLTLGMRQPAGQRLMWLLLGWGMVTLSLTDGVYFGLSARGGNGQTGGPVVVGWMIAALLVGLATLIPHRTTDALQTRRSAQFVELIPYLPVVGAIVWVASFGIHRHPFVLVTGAALLLALAFRQVMIVFENVTLTGNLEKKVAELHSLGSIVTSSRDAIVGASRDGRITSWNPTAERLFGYPSGAMIGQTLDVISPLRQQELHQLIARAERGEDIAGYELDWARPDGTSVQVGLAISPILRGKTFQGISISGQDITERRLVTRHWRRPVRTPLKRRG